MEVRYENLIDSSAATLTGILDFLGLPGDPEEMLSHFKLHDRSIGAWRRVFTGEDRKSFAKAAGDLLIELGYERDHSWVRSGGGPLVCGRKGSAFNPEYFKGFDTVLGTNRHDESL
jgi:hypothetical protein